VPLMHEVYQKVTSFWLEHVSEPLQSIYRELFTRRGREDVTDRVSGILVFTYNQ
jgi:hypothetical protein